MQREFQTIHVAPFFLLQDLSMSGFFIPEEKTPEDDAVASEEANDFISEKNDKAVLLKTVEQDRLGEVEEEEQPVTKSPPLFFYLHDVTVFPCH